MTKQINLEWMNELLKSDNTAKEFQNDLPQIDWVSNGKSFKKEVRFKVMPANSKENNIFSAIVGTHWNLGPNNRRFICPEQTLHLKKLGIECPICAAKRKLLAKGFTEEELSVQGKFGLISVFDPQITSNVKVVVTETDLKRDWDKAHVSILQQKGSFLTKWLVRKYKEHDTPDFLPMERSNLIKFSRPTENGKWEREISFGTFEPSQEILEKLREENEALTLPELWKMPSDQDLLEIKQIAAEMVNNYEEARASMKANASDSIEDDDLPF